MNPTNIICVKMDNNCFIRNDEINVLDYDDESGNDIIFVVRLCRDCRNLYIFASDLVKSEQSYIPVYADTFKNIMQTMILDMGEDVQCIIDHLIVYGAERHITPKNKYTAYKATTEENKCINKHYSLHTKYKEDKCIICSHGIHACICPLDCFAYYSPNENNKYFVGHGILEDTYYGINYGNTKSVFSEFTLDEELSINSIIKESKDYISKYGHYMEREDGYGSHILSDDRNYSYIISKYVGSVFGRSSIVEVSDIGGISSAFGYTSIAKCNSLYSTAIANDDRSIAYSAADYSASLSYNVSRSISRGDYSIAASYNCGLSVTDGKKSISESIGTDEMYNEGCAITNEKESVAVGICTEKIICKKESSVAVGINTESIKVEGNGSVAVAQGSVDIVDIASNSVAVLMVHKYDCINFVGGENSYIMINLLDENSKIKSSKTLHIDGKRILPGVIYTYNSNSDTIVSN